MPSATEPAAGLRLEPRARINRRLSVAEYMHASVGISGRTLEPPRPAVLVLEGQGPEFEPQVWRDALARVNLENPGCHLRMSGRWWGARWMDDAPPPRLRVVERTAWDGMSDEGSGFIYAEPMSLEHGPTVEFILVNHSPRGRLVILRSLHAVMDGGGALHLLRELFRALRGEPLLGSNATFSDIDLMRALGPRKSTSHHALTDFLTGRPQGDERGDQWRRVVLDTSGTNILARIGATMAQYFHQHSSRPAMFVIPVDLRRRLPGLLATTNFSGMLLVRLEKGEGEDAFRRKLGAMIEGRMELFYPRALGLVKMFSLARFDRLLSRTEANYRRKRALETAVISNLGRIDSRDYSCSHFTLTGLFAQPLAGTVFSVLLSIDGRVEFLLNMPKVLASNGRFDEFFDYLQRRLAETETGKSGEGLRKGLPS
jgi:hypothetical protein